MLIVTTAVMYAGGLMDQIFLALLMAIGFLPALVWLPRGLGNWRTDLLSRWGWVARGAGGIGLCFWGPMLVYEPMIGPLLVPPVVSGLGAGVAVALRGAAVLGR